MITDSRISNNQSQYGSPVPVLAVDTGWMAVDKPADMSVHNEPGKDLCSVMTGVVKNNTLLADRLAGDEGFGLHPVHRLDRETSGVMLMACRSDILRLLAEQFQLRHVKKRYQAIVHGKFDLDSKSKDWHLWDWKLSRNAGGRRQPAGSGSRLESRTRFRVLRQGTRYTLIECELLTGRKHQIRRHARLAGHAIVGDSRYGTVRAAKYLAQHHGFSRLALHAVSLAFHPPQHPRPVVIKTGGLPPQMLRLFEDDLPGSFTQP